MKEVALPRKRLTLARFALVSALGIVLLLGGAVCWCTAMPGVSHSGALPALTSAETRTADELRRHVTALAVEIGERRAVSGDSLHRAERYLQGELAAIVAAHGGQLRREPLQGAPGDPANLVLELPGAVKAPLLLLGAHYDTAPEGTRGANDNGSGSAAALVLAKALAQTKHRLPLRVVLFANEEMPYFQTGLMGSLQHARACRERGEELKAMFSLETMGYYSDAPGSQRYPAPLDKLYPDRGNFIAFVGNVGSRGLVRDSIGRFRAHASIPSEGGALPSILPGVGWSDHWAFWQHGFPAIMLTDTAPFRDPTYHRASDVATNLDYERLARVVVAFQKVVVELAAAP